MVQFACHPGGGRICPTKDLGEPRDALRFFATQYEFSAAQLKMLQEVITLTVFAAFSVFYLKQPLRWNHVAGFAMIVGAVGVIFKQW
jgi:uncharacterized protein (DUF486 family)